jgi:hypothetical protein
MKPKKIKPVVYKVNDKLQVTKTPIPLPQLIGAQFVVANVTEKEYHLKQLNLISGNALLVLSKDEIQNEVFTFKRIK